MGDRSKGVANLSSPQKIYKKKFQRKFLWNAATSKISGLVWLYFSPMYLLQRERAFSRSPVWILAATDPASIGEEREHYLIYVSTFTYLNYMQSWAPTKWKNLMPAKTTKTRQPTPDNQEPATIIESITRKLKPTPEN
jgi:hypothetical protein